MINTATLYRVEKADAGTFGVFLLDGEAFCVTLEPPDLGNRSDVSCIPEGRYRCMPVDSPHFGRTYEITDVPGRTHILFHPGNLRRDTHGCVLLAGRFGVLGSERAVLGSRPVCDQFLLRAGWDAFDLTIIDATARTNG
jgi:hypothetical protein